MERSKLIRLIIICLFGAGTILGAISIATSNKSKLKYLEKQSREREEKLLHNIDSLNNVTTMQANEIIQRDCTIVRREEHITEMLQALNSDDKEIKDSLRKIPIDKILEELRK